VIERRNGRYRARFRAPSGRERSRTFDLKRDAQDWLDTQRGEVARGTWVDPRRARLPFADWARDWQAAQIHHRETTAARTDSLIRNHLLPRFGDQPIGSITRTEVQAWVSSLTGRLAPRTLEGVYRLLATILRSAVDERVIGVTPCRGVRLPEVVAEAVRIPTLDELGAMTEALPAYYRRVVPVVAGTGMRQGEVLGLTVDRVDWLRRKITVDRQLQSLPSGRVAHVPTKRASSNRVIPVSAQTIDVLSAQIAEYPSRDGLIFHSRTGQPIRRSTWGDGWRRATITVGVEGLNLHHVRHFYASMLIRQGLSVPVVAARLGHADASVTLGIYAHVWPDDEERTRAAVDEMLAAASWARPGPGPGG